MRRPAGVRHRRLDRPATLARRPRGAARRLLRRATSSATPARSAPATPARSCSTCAAGSTRSAGTPIPSTTASRPAGRPLGRAEAGRRDRLRRVDPERPAPPAAIRGAPARQDREGVPPRAPDIRRRRQDGATAGSDRHAAGGIQREARLHQDPRARRGRGEDAQAADLRRAGAPRLGPPLRLPPRGRRRAQELVGPQGPVARPVGEAAGRPGRGPPDRLRDLRGHDPPGPVRRRHGHHLGPRHLREPDGGQARAEDRRRGDRRRADRVRHARRAAQGEVRPDPHEVPRQGQAAVAAHEVEGRVRRGGDGDRGEAEAGGRSRGGARRQPSRSRQPRRPKRSSSPTPTASSTPRPGSPRRTSSPTTEKVADRLLPFLKDRPVTLERLPDGLAEGAPHFWQKDTPDYYPDWIPRIELETERGKAGPLRPGQRRGDAALPREPGDADLPRLGVAGRGPRPARLRALRPRPGQGAVRRRRRGGQGDQGDARRARASSRS